MRDDRELLYAAGELTANEREEYERCLSAEARLEADCLKAAFSELRASRDCFPEPQISFERVRHAIETTSPPPQRAWPWQRWIWIGAPAAAAVLGLALLWPRGATLPTAEDTPGPIASLAAPEIEAGAMATPSVQEPEAPPVVAAPAPAPQPEVRVAEPAPRLPARRQVRRLVAVVTPRPAAAMSKAAPALAATPPAPALTNGGQLGDSGAREPGGDAPTEEMVVVVTRTKNESTGANSAMEVRRHDDVVLGG